MSVPGHSRHVQGPLEKCPGISVAAYFLAAGDTGCLTRGPPCGLAPSRVGPPSPVDYGLLFSAGSAFADAEMLKKFNCTACHAIDQKRLVPPLKDVAVKYAGDSSVSALGVDCPMPAQPQVSDADGKTLAEYILSLK